MKQSKTELKLDKVIKLILPAVLLVIFSMAKGQQTTDICLHYRFESDSAIIYRVIYDDIYTSSPQINFAKNNDSLTISYGYKLINQDVDDPFKEAYFTSLAEFKTDQFGNKPERKDSLNFVEKLFNINLFLPEYSSQCIKTGDFWTAENDLHSALYKKVLKKYQLVEHGESDSTIKFSGSYFISDNLSPETSIEGEYLIDNKNGTVIRADLLVNLKDKNYSYKMIITRISEDGFWKFQ